MRVSNTNPFRADAGDDAAAHAPRLLDEMERAIVEAGPETVAMIIAEPVQNAGGCLVPPDGYWAGLRELADRYGIALVADEVITGFGRIGEWFAAPRYGATPDLITCAKGITSAYAPMGAVLVSDRIAEPLYDDGPDAPARHHLRRPPGRGGDGAAQHRDLRARGRAGERPRARGLPRRAAARAAGAAADRRRRPRRRASSGRSSWSATRPGTRFGADERERLLRGFLTGRLLEEGLIARPDDRGDAVLHLAPPLICGREELDEMVAKTEAVLADASERFFGAA